MLSLLFLLFGLLALCIVYIFVNIIRQLLLPNTKEPPVVFYWFPWLGSAITYGKDPYKFLFAAKAKYRDVFTFVLLGRNVTVHLGVAGNDFVFNGKETHVNAEEIYGPLCSPVFGEGVVYDCPNSKLMEQKKFVKFGLTTDALKAHVRLIEQEVVDYIKTSREFKGQSGTINVPPVMAQITIFTAAIALQGPKCAASSPTSLQASQLKMRKIYETIIAERRAGKMPPTTDMISHLMQCAYKDGDPIPDLEIANMMITILMAGQHNSSNIASWIMLHLANEPQLCEELYQEQLDQLADEHGNLPELDLQALEKLKLHSNVVKETLRIHNAIHSIMRLVKQPLPVPSTHWTIPPGHAILASPGISANSEEYFSNPNKWSPHRWDDRVIEEDDESEMVDYGYGRMSKGTKSAYLPFGGGRHRCIGEKFAYLNLEVITAIMVRNFRLKTLMARKMFRVPTIAPCSRAR
ncbi:hypothetical protein P3342_009092 [Pyrenophora teres f. teres]|nr:hypothetical protein P3342_009092 [Pyrenophora teres f. teres]